MKILLHTCCSCCMIYPLSILRDKGHHVSVYFYNPNIHPSLEYLDRYASVKKHCMENNIELFLGDYDTDNYFRSAIDVIDDRCPTCYELRLNKTAKLAAEKGFDAISTTLLISIYQKHEKIAEIGNKVAGENSINFIYEDFRPFFQEAQNKSKELGMYRQKYCGCVFSEKERYKKKINKIYNDKGETR